MRASDQPLPASADSEASSSVDGGRLLLATDLAELVARYSPLRPTGIDSVLRRQCPLCRDDSSLFLVLHSETFRCFSCGAHGDALQFVMLAEGTDGPGALQRIREFAQTCDAGQQIQRIDSVTFRTMTNVYTRAAKFYMQQLAASPDAIGYLQKRGITEETAAFWRLGYAPDSGHTLQDELKDYPIELLVNAGLVVHRQDGMNYDRLRSRLTFPIRAKSGDIVAFGGRLLGSGQPKYLNSPETPIFKKGLTLYGQYESSLVDCSVDGLWIVEGYMDVVTLWQHGIRNCVATLGTSITTELVLQLLRVTRNLLFCFDGDSAGRAASWRAVEHTLPVLRSGRSVRFLILPQGEDPDSLVRQEGVHVLQSLADQALSLAAFLARDLAAGYDMRHIEGRGRYLASAAPLIAKVRDGGWRSEISSEIAERAHVPSEMVERLADAETAADMRLTRAYLRQSPT